jgi:hypothetical protein
MMSHKLRNLSGLKKLPDNPRTIKNEDFRRLVQSIKDNPDYFKARPLILSDRTGELVIIAGNQRFDAAQEAGLKQVPTFLMTGLTEERERELIIRDNVSAGEWDMDMLADWDLDDLGDWGLDIAPAEVKKTKDIPKTGQVDISPELLLEHNYVVLYFDNPLDWEVAKEKLQLTNVKSGDPASPKTGVGRVIQGKDIIRRLDTDTDE